MKKFNSLKALSKKGVIVNFTGIVYTDKELKDQADTMLDNDELLSVTKSGDLSASAYLSESHGCCAKAYIHDFNGNSEELIQAAEIIARRKGYTNLGLTHVVTAQVVKDAKKLGFKVLRKFTNKRTGNKLVELYKTL